MSTDRFISGMLSDGLVITYRVLSRLAKVHVNEAKSAMTSYLESHPDTHATYVLNGVLKPPTIIIPSNGHTKTEENGMDVDQSPDASANVDATQATGGEAVKVSGFRLLQAADLYAGKALFDSVTSCQIYSLETSALRDITLATTANAALASDKRCVSAWATSKNGAQFGIIQHPTRKFDAKASSKPPKASTSKSATAEAKSAPKRKVESDDEEVKLKPKPSSGKGKGRAVVGSEDEEDLASSPASKARAGKAKAKPSSTKGKAKAELAKDSSDDEPVKPKVKAKKVKRSASGRMVREITRTTKDEKGRRVMETIEESYDDTDEEEAKPSKKSKPAVKPETATEDKPAKVKFSTSSAAPAKKKIKADENGQTGLSSFFKKK